MKEHCQTIRPDRSLPGCETVSAVGLAAFVAALHMAVLAGHVSGRSSQQRALSQIRWRMPTDESPDAPCSRARIGSNPHRSYNCGRLELARGMAVVALAAFINVIRTNGALGR
jgi:hypothetical protein